MKSAIMTGIMKNDDNYVGGLEYASWYGVGLEK